MKRLMAENQLREILAALPPGGNMLEWGMGGSTLWLLERLGAEQSLTSVEHNAAWRAKALEEYRASGMSAKWLSLLKPVPWEGRNATPWEECPAGCEDYIEPEEVPFWVFDVFLVDGIARGACLAAVAAKAREGARVFLHDSQRSWYRWAERLLDFVREIEPDAGDYPSRLKEFRVR